MEDWRQQYNIIGKIGEGGYGIVFLAKSKFPADLGKSIAIKKFKQLTSYPDLGVPPSVIREIKLLRETSHENVVKLLNVHTIQSDMTLCLALEYAEHDLSAIISHHRLNVKCAINRYTVKSLLWQLLNGVTYLHSNLFMHRDIKPSNILVMGKGNDEGTVKIADYGLARIFKSPLRPLSADGDVATLSYRAPELLLGAKHYTTAIDIWAIGCIFAELLTLNPLFKGLAMTIAPNAFQLDQLYKIFMVLGHPTTDMWPLLADVPHWKSNTLHVQSIRCHGSILDGVVNLSQDDPAYDLLSKMLKYDPLQRITAAQALEHTYFRIEPLPGRNALIEPVKKVIYPKHRVNTKIKRF